MFKPSNRRRTLIIGGLQIKMIIAVLGLVIGISLILLAVSFYLFNLNLHTLPVGESLLGPIMTNSLVPVIFITIILFAASTWAVILMSHKIYGPLHRFGIYIRKLSSGEATDELKFRTGDAVDGLKEVYNEIRQVLEKTLNYDYNEMSSIFHELQNLLDKIYHKKIDDKDLYNRLQDLCNRIAHALDITSDVIEPEDKKR